MSVPSGPRRFEPLRELYRAALAGVDPERAVSIGLARSDVRRVLKRAARVGVFAVGKAAAGMARAAAARFGAVPTLVIVPRGEPGGHRLGRGRTRFAAHPEPDASSARAAREALEFFASFGEGDAIVCLVSGGASSLLALPRPGTTLAQKRRAVRELAASGAPISRINRLRISLSSVKGGRLGRATDAALVNLVLSDVPGDAPALVGSGPTIRRRKSDVVRVVASNRDGLEAAASAAREIGLTPWLDSNRIEGDARADGFRIGRMARELSPGSVLLAGGEASVRLERARGRGGRCLELALGAAEALRGAHDVVLLAAGSDGVDGTSGAAGAFADGLTMPRLESRRLAAGDALRRHDTRSLFAALGDLFVTGPTGTNVADWVFAIRLRGARSISRG